MSCSEDVGYSSSTFSANLRLRCCSSAFPFDFAPITTLHFLPAATFVWVCTITTQGTARIESNHFLMLGDFSDHLLDLAPCSRYYAREEQDHMFEEHRSPDLNWCGLALHYLRKLKIAFQSSWGLYVNLFSFVSEWTSHLLYISTKSSS